MTTNTPVSCQQPNGDDRTVTGIDNIIRYCCGRKTSCCHAGRVKTALHGRDRLCMTGSGNRRMKRTGPAGRGLMDAKVHRWDVAPVSVRAQVRRPLVSPSTWDTLIFPVCSCHPFGWGRPCGRWGASGDAAEVFALTNSTTALPLRVRATVRWTRQDWDKPTFAIGRPHRLGRRVFGRTWHHDRMDSPARQCAELMRRQVREEDRTHNGTIWRGGARVEPTWVGGSLWHIWQHFLGRSCPPVSPRQRIACDAVPLNGRRPESSRSTTDPSASPTE
jgi:hypothetical protein